MQQDQQIYRMPDNGLGFDMKYYNKRFGVFQRLHEAEGFPDNVALAIVQRVVERHRGRVWAKGKLGRDACSYFSLPRG